MAALAVMRLQSAKFKLHMVSRSGQQIQTGWTGSGVNKGIGLSKQCPSTSWTSSSSASTRICSLVRPTCLPTAPDHRGGRIPETQLRTLTNTPKLQAHMPMTPDSNPTCHSHVLGVTSDQKDCRQRRQIQEQEQEQEHCLELVG